MVLQLASGALALVRRCGGLLYVLVIDGKRWALVPFRAVASFLSRVFYLSAVSVLVVKSRLSQVPVRSIAVATSTSAHRMASVPVAAVRRIILIVIRWWTDWLDSRRRAREAAAQRLDRTDAALRAPPAPEPEPELERKPEPEPEPEPEPVPEAFRIGDLIAARERAMMSDQAQSRVLFDTTHLERSEANVNEELFGASRRLGRDQPPPSQPADELEVEEPLATEERRAAHSHELLAGAFASTEARASAFSSETVDGMQLASAYAAAIDDPRERSEVHFLTQRFRLDSNGNPVGIGSDAEADAEAESASTEDLVESRRKSALHPESLAEKPAEASVRPLEKSEEQLRVNYELELEPTAIERGEQTLSETTKTLGDSLEWARLSVFL